MKLIFENWRRFLKKQKSGVSKQNLELLLKKMYEDNRWSDSDSLYGLLVNDSGSYYKSLFPPNVHAMWNGEEPYDFKVIEDAREGARLLYIANIVEQVPQLKQNKIKRILGIGTQGVVFELDNGRALKLYRRGYVDDQEGFYDNEAGKIFSGQGRIMTLPIFDRGKTSPDFNKFLERTGRLDKGLRYRPVDWENEFFLKNILKLTDAEIKSLSNMINYALENYGLDYLGDLHTGNFGVLEQTMSSKNPVFVLFDP
jgi:hypothetical protein